VKRGEVYAIGVDTAKSVLYQRMQRVTAHGPGYIHLDASCDEAWLEQFSSETRVYRIVQGRRVPLWRPRQTGIRQEALDCTVYAWCALQGRGGAELLRKRALQRGVRSPATTAPVAAVPAEQAPEPDQPKAQPPAPRPSSSTWVRPRRGSWFKR
jgi:phage terminase large subunit GpA-like protein